MKQISSLITTQQKAPNQKAGTQAGERGLAMQSNTKISVWLASKAPEDLDKAAVSRAQQHGVTLAVKYQGRYPSGPNGEKLPSYVVATGCGVHGTQAQRDAAIEDLLKFETPAEIRDIEMWLTELSVISASRNRDHGEAEMVLTAYSSRLARYPADVARYAVLSKSWKWWPSWDELERVCEAKAGPRRHMIAALQQPVPDPEPETRPPSQEEKDRMAAMIAEMFPNVPQHWRDAALRDATKGDCIRSSVEDAAHGIAAQ